MVYKPKVQVQDSNTKSDKLKDQESDHLTRSKDKGDKYEAKRDTNKIDKL